MNTRTIVKATKCCSWEELQSDWGQEGKKKGFDEKYKESEVKVLAEDVSQEISLIYFGIYFRKRLHIWSR